jgi:hypothetical protein
MNSQNSFFIFFFLIQNINYNSRLQYDYNIQTMICGDNEIVIEEITFFFFLIQVLTFFVCLRSEFWAATWKT